MNKIKFLPWGVYRLVRKTVNKQVKTFNQELQAAAGWTVQNNKIANEGLEDVVGG